jgi:hypothetical protein
VAMQCGAIMSGDRSNTHLLNIFIGQFFAPFPFFVARNRGLSQQQSEEFWLFLDFYGFLP